MSEKASEFTIFHYWEMIFHFRVLMREKQKNFYLSWQYDLKETTADWLTCWDMCISFTIHSFFVILSQTFSSKLKTRTISFCFSVHKIVEKCWFKDQILVATKNEKIMKNKGSLADKRHKRLFTPRIIKPRWSPCQFLTCHISLILAIT